MYRLYTCVSTRLWPTIKKHIDFHQQVLWQLGRVSGRDKKQKKAGGETMKWDGGGEINIGRTGNRRDFEGRRGKMEWEVEYIKFQCHSLGLGNC